MRDQTMASTSRIKARAPATDMEAWLRAQTSHVAEHFRHVSPKSAATANLVLLLLVTVGVALWQPSFRLQRAASPENPLTPAPAAVKMIDAAPRGSECREQT